MSDVIATMFLLAVTVTLVGATALEINAISSDEVAEELTLDTLAIATAGRDEITLIHAGGSPLDSGDLRALVAINGATWFDGSLSGSGAWQLGEARSIGPLAQAIPVDAKVEVTIADRVARQVIAEVSTRALGVAVPAVHDVAGFTIDLLMDGGTEVIVEPPTGIIVEASIEHPQGRKFVRLVYADFSGFDGIAWQGLRDDGSGGDRVAGDGIYAGKALVPVNATSGQVQVTVRAVDFNGTEVSDSAPLRLLVRNEITERTLNPNGAPASGLVALCPTGIAAIRSVEFVVNEQTAIPRLTGNVRQGDHVQALVTLVEGCSNVQVTFATYRASGPTFSWTDATRPAVYEADSRTIASGQALLAVDVPRCYFKIDLARGAAIPTLGLPDQNSYYSRQGRLIDTDNGGTTPCA